VNEENGSKNQQNSGNGVKRMMVIKEAEYVTDVYGYGTPMFNAIESLLSHVKSLNGSALIAIKANGREIVIWENIEEPKIRDLANAFHNVVVPPKQAADERAKSAKSQG
jgi:hypothetical protein